MSTSNDNAKICVTNLPAIASEDMLYELFERFGDIKNITLTGRHTDRRTAFIEFFDEASAVDAKEEMMGYKIDKNHSIRVEPVKPKPVGVSNLVIKGLPKGVGNEELDEIFSRFGDIYSTSIKLVGDKVIAHVQFCQADSVRETLNKMGSGYNWNGHQITVKAVGISTACNLVITNISTQTTPAIIERALGEFGETGKAIVNHRNHCGHCLMMNIEEAIEAIENLTGEALAGSVISVWKDFTSPEERETYAREGKVIRVKNYGTATERDLLDHFSQYGSVLCVFLNRNGIYTIYFRETRSAIDCISDSTEVKFNNQRLNISLEKWADIMNTPQDCIRALLMEEYDFTDAVITPLLSGLSPVQMISLIWNPEKRVKWLHSRKLN